MQNSFQVVFKGMDPNKEIEAEVRAWAVKLRSLTDAAGLLSGHVVVESLERTGAQRHGGARFCATVELRTLEANVVIAADQDGNKMHEDVYVAVRNAFRALRRELVVHNQRRLLPGAGAVAGDAPVDDVRSDGEIS
jgi:hypothetical protein